jgi:hypothetical protein
MSDWPLKLKEAIEIEIVYNYVSQFFDYMTLLFLDLQETYYSIHI